MKKRLISIVMALVMMASLAGITVSADQDNAPIVKVDGREINFADQKPVILENEGRTLVPARGVFECMGARVDWDEEKRLVTINSSTNITRILITIDDPVMVVYTFTSLLSADKTEIMLDAAPRIMNDRTMIPLRAISEALNTTVKWDEATRTVSIFTKDYDGDTEATPGVSSSPSATSDPDSTARPTSSPSSTSGPSQTAAATDEPGGSEFVSKTDGVEMSITSDKKTAAVGDTVEVYVNLKGIQDRLQNNEAVSAVTFGLKYDSDILEYVEGSLKFNVKGNCIDVINPNFDNNKLKAACVAVEYDNNIPRVDGEFARLSFRVKSSGTASIKISTDIDTRVGYDSSVDIVNTDNYDITPIRKDMKVNTNEIKIN